MKPRRLHRWFTAAMLIAFILGYTVATGTLEPEGGSDGGA